MIGSSSVQLQHRKRYISAKEAVTTCRICLSKVPAGGGSTCNLFSHLKKHHSKEFVKLKQTTQPGSSNSSKSSQKFSQSQKSFCQATMKDLVNKSKSNEKNGKEIARAYRLCDSLSVFPIYICCGEARFPGNAKKV